MQWIKPRVTFEKFIARYTHPANCLVIAWETRARFDIMLQITYGVISFAFIAMITVKQTLREI